MPRRAWPCLLVLLAAGCMEQSKPQPQTRQPSLYTRLGGEPFLERAVDTFVARVANPRTGMHKATREYFQVGGDALKRELVEELGALLGGPQPPRRDKLLEMFRVAGGQDAQELQAVLRQACKDAGAAARDLEEVEQRLTALREEAVGKKEQR